MAKKHDFKHPKEEKSSSGALIGWGFIVIVLFSIAVMILNANTQPDLICDSRSGASLNQFGTCRAVR